MALCAPIGRSSGLAQTARGQKREGKAEGYGLGPRLARGRDRRLGRDSLQHRRQVSLRQPRGQHQKQKLLFEAGQGTEEHLVLLERVGRFTRHRAGLLARPFASHSAGREARVRLTDDDQTVFHFQEGPTEPIGLLNIEGLQARLRKVGHHALDGSHSQVGIAHSLVHLLAQPDGPIALDDPERRVEDAGHQHTQVIVGNALVVQAGEGGAHCIQEPGVLAGLLGKIPEHLEAYHTVQGILTSRFAFDQAEPEVLQPVFAIGEDHSVVQHLQVQRDSRRRCGNQAHFTYPSIIT